MTLQNFVNQLLDSLGGADRAVLEEQYGLWDLFARKLRGKKMIQATGVVSENELRSAKGALADPERMEEVERFVEQQYRTRYKEDKTHAHNIWNRDSLLEPVFVGGTKNEFNPAEAIAYWLISDIFYSGRNPFEEKVQHCAGELFCSTDETRITIGEWDRLVRSALENAGGTMAWAGLIQELDKAGTDLMDDNGRLMQKFIRFSADFAITEQQEVRLLPSGGRGAGGLSKGLQMYLRARKFPAPLHELAGAYRMPRWILLACLLGRSDMFILLPTGEFRLITR